MTNKKERFWDRIAKNYDTQVNEGDQAAIKILENINKYLQKDDIVLDYACATGKFTFEITDLVQEIQGIDISSEMISIANGIAEERDIDNVHFTKATLFDERNKKESFNVILAFNILHLLEEPQQVMQQINALLKPGGLFISATECMGKGNSFLQIVLWPLSKMGVVPFLNYFQPSDLEGLIANGNFEIIETEDLSTSSSNYYIAARKM